MNREERLVSVAADAFMEGWDAADRTRGKSSFVWGCLWGALAGVIVGALLKAALS